MSNDTRHKGFATYKAEKSGTGFLYYFSLTKRTPPPYHNQKEVKAIIDIADDGTLAGVELIWDMPEPPNFKEL